MKKFNEYLEAIVTQKESLKKAVEMISGELKSNPKANRIKLIEKACQQFNCDPKQEQFLINKYEEAFPMSMKPINDNHIDAATKAKIKNAKSDEDAVNIALQFFKDPDQAEAYVEKIRG